MTHVGIFIAGFIHKSPKCTSTLEWINCTIFTQWNAILQQQKRINYCYNVANIIHMILNKEVTEEYILHEAIYMVFRNRQT